METMERQKKSYTGNVKLSFTTKTESEEELYDLIENQIPKWLKIDLIDITDIEEVYEQNREK